MDAEFLAALKATKEQTTQIEDFYQQKLLKTLLPQITAEFEPLFAERQQFLDAKEGFWTTAILDKNSPASAFASDVDTKVLRSLISVRVTKKVESGADNVLRTLTFVLRPSIFCSGGEMSRTMNSDGNTVACVEAGWKVPEQARRGSILRVFDPKCGNAEAKEIIDAVDLVFQNPTVILQE